MAAIASHGLEIEGIWGKHHVAGLQTFTSTAGIPPQHFDLALITTKSYDTRQAVEQVSSLLSPDSLAISLQNGLGNIEVISEIVGAAHTLGGRVIFGAQVLALGRVEVTVYQDKVMLGSLTGAIPQKRIEEIAGAFTAAGIPSSYTDDITGYLWGKVLYNCCLNPMSALLECSYGELGENAETREIMAQVIAEVFTVARRSGVKLRWQSPQEYYMVLLDSQIPPTSAHHSSMLQDIRQGKRTEIDSMNGAIVKLGEGLGMEIPINLMLTRLVKAKEQQHMRINPAGPAEIPLKE